MFSQRCLTMMQAVALAAALFLCPSGRGTADEYAAESPTYGGRTLPEWRVLIKDVPASILASEGMADGLQAIVADTSAPLPDRRNAAFTLARMGDAAAQSVPTFRAILAHESDSQASVLMALKALGRLGPVAEAAVPDIEGFIRDSNESVLVRATAMEALAQAGVQHPRTVPTLLQVLQSPVGETPLERSELQRYAVEALGTMGPAATPAIPELIRAAQGDWPLLRLSAVRTLGKMGPRAEIAIPTLFDTVLFDNAAENREAAAEVLGQLGSLAIVPLERLLNDRDLATRRLAIRGLSRSTSPQEAVPVLKAVLADPDPLVRVEGAAAICGLTNERTEAQTMLLEGLSNSNRNVRITAYRALLSQIEDLATFHSQLEALSSDHNQPRQTRIAADHLLRRLDEISSQ